MEILLLITGSISAYKTPSIANALTKQGHNVKIVATKSALKFIGKLSFTAQGYELFEDNDEYNTNSVLHIDLITWADIVLIAPMSANTLSKIANGITDNLLTSILRAFPYEKSKEKKMIFAPAMNTDMYMHPITNEQIEKIEGWFDKSEVNDRFLVVQPVEKKLACGVVGKGALASIGSILKAIE